MSQKKHKHKTNVRKTTNRPAPASPVSPTLKHNTKRGPVTPRQGMRYKRRKSILSNPLAMILIGAGLVAIVVLGILLVNRKPAIVNDLPDTIGVDEAYQKYQAGSFVLDVRTQAEWDEYHAPNTTHIPLDELENRLNELPKDEEIVVICRSGNRSDDGRDILLKNGFTAVTSMDGGLKEWSAAGYPIEGTRP